MTAASRMGLLALVGQVSMAGASMPQRPPWQQDGPAARVETPHLVAETDPVSLAALPDDQLTLRVRVAPRGRMRVYAHDVTGYVPLTLGVNPLAGLTVRTVRFPPSRMYVFPPTGEMSRVFETPFVVEVAVALSARLRRGLVAGDASITAHLRYQACDDRLCYRPDQVHLTWTIAP